MIIDIMVALIEGADVLKQIQSTFRYAGWICKSAGETVIDRRKNKADSWNQLFIWSIICWNVSNWWLTTHIYAIIILWNVSTNREGIEMKAVLVSVWYIIQTLFVYPMAMTGFWHLILKDLKSIVWFLINFIVVHCHACRLAVSCIPDDTIFCTAAGARLNPLTYLQLVMTKAKGIYTHIVTDHSTLLGGMAALLIWLGTVPGEGFRGSGRGSLDAGLK